MVILTSDFVWNIFCIKFFKEKVLHYTYKNKINRPKKKNAPSCYVLRCVDEEEKENFCCAEY